MSDSFSPVGNYKRNLNIYDISTNSKNDGSILEYKIIEKVIYKKFNEKYNSMNLKYNSNIIENIIFNDKTHLVSKFKEHLLFDDQAEFFKRYYALYESFIRLPKFFKFYDLYSKIFPNYTSFEEGKYFYRNIQQKQRVINTIEKIELEAKMNKNKMINNNKDDSEDKVFSSKIIDSLLNSTNDEGMEMIFNINKKNMKKDDNNFINDINNIIDEIDKRENKKENKQKRNINLIQKKQVNHILKINNNKYIIKIKNINCDNINHNINNTRRETQINSKNKLTNKTSKPKIKTILENKENYNILNLCSKNNYTNLYHKPNNKMKNIPKLLFIEKLENNHNKIRKKIIHNKKSFSQNVSTFIKSTKEISTSRQNKSLCNRTKNPILDNTNKSYKKYQNGVIYIKNKKKKDEIINYKKEILKIDLSKSKLFSRNNCLNFSLSKLSNSNKYNYTNHNSFLSKNEKSHSKTNILHHISNATFTHKKYDSSTYNFNMINNLTKNNSFKKISKTKWSETNKNSKDSKDKKYSTKKFNYIKRNSSKIDSLFSNHTNANSILSFNDSKINSKLKTNYRRINSILYASNLTTRRESKESKKSNLRNQLIKKDNLNSNNSNNKKEIKVNKKEYLNKYTYNNYINTKIIRKNNSVLKICVDETKKPKKGKIKNIKINNFSKLFNVFIKHSRNDTNYNYNPQTERTRIKTKF